MPQQSERAVESLAGLLQSHHLLKGGVGVAQSHELHYCAFHEHKWLFDDAERSALVYVEKGVVVTRAAAKAGTVGKSERRILAKPGSLVSARGRRGLPTQVVLTSANLDLPDPNPGHGLAQPLRLLTDQSRIAKVS